MTDSERRWSLAAAISSIAVFGIGIGIGAPLLSLMLEGARHRFLDQRLERGAGVRRRVARAAADAAFGGTVRLQAFPAWLRCR